MYNVQRNDESLEEIIIARPLLDAFLDDMSKLFEIWVWTASDRAYAEYALDIIVPGCKHIKKVLTSEYCIVNNGCYIKDIRIFEGMNMNKIIIVDNLLVSFASMM